MALTAEVKDELARVSVTRPEEMTAEIAGLLRYSAGLHLVAGRIVVEAEVDSGATARRVSQAVEELFELTAEMQVVGEGTCAPPPGTSCVGPRAAPTWPGVPA